MDDFQIDGRHWKFLDNPESYIKNESGGLQLAHLTRQFKTAKAILNRFKKGYGVLLADDVGLGKTTIGALVAWSVANQEKRVRIYAPNEVLRRRWAEELERHIPMLEDQGANSAQIKQGEVEKLKAGRIQVTTHRALVKSHNNNELRTACDLMIIDEAHRAKGDGSAFSEALRNLGSHAKRKLILTATPFSIGIDELERLLTFVGATHFEAVRCYAKELSELYSLGDGHDAFTKSKRLVDAAKAAIEELRPYLIRHSIDDLSVEERKHFGKIAEDPWEIPTPPADSEDLTLLLRMDRLLQLVPEREGEKRNDPRFHTGWQHVATELEQAKECASNPTAIRHIAEADTALRERRTKPHPKVAAVSNAIRPLLDAGEKVLVFCHHHATASELLSEFERSLKTTRDSSDEPPVEVWRSAWESLLAKDDRLTPIIDWLCTPGLRAQVSSWLGKPASTAKGLATQLLKARPRSKKYSVPTIFEAAKALTEVLLDRQSTSTRAVLRRIKGGQAFEGGGISHFPGRLDDGFRVMGAWNQDGPSETLQTLYTGKPDIVIALFNSPFGPDVLVTTDHLSEGVDLHRYCRHLIHYELDPSPVRTLQRNGRVRRVGSWASLIDQPIQYAYPTFSGTRDEKAVDVMRQRIDAFGLLLGGTPSLKDDIGDDDSSQQNFANDVMENAKKELSKLNKRLAI